MNTKKGSVQIVGLAIVVVLALAGLVYVSMNRHSALPSNLPNYQTQTTSSQPVISSDKDLTSTSTDLDNTDLNSVDQQLNQNDADLKFFGPRIRLKNGTSLNWAGYAVETNLSNPKSDAVSDVKGQWVVPSVSCAGTTTNTYSASWIGIDGYGDNSVEQTGTEQDCINGQPSYSAWYEMYPKPSFRINFPVPIKAGDTISAEVKYVNNKFVLTLKDVTTGQTFSTTQKSNALRQSAEWISEAPWSGSILPLANFGTMQFSNAQATLGSTMGTISNSAWQNDQITMTNSSGAAKATPSSLSSDGGSFSITWNSN